jgi:hypothetical protein
VFKTGGLLGRSQRPAPPTQRLLRKSIKTTLRRKVLIPLFIIIRDKVRVARWRSRHF